MFFTVIIFTMIIFTVIINVSKNLGLPLSILIHNFQIYLAVRNDIHFNIDEILLAFC